jgi:hypothetical protein
MTLPKFNDYPFLNAQKLSIFQPSGVSYVIVAKVEASQNSAFWASVSNSI